MIRPHPTTRPIKPWLLWVEGQLVCLVCSGDFEDKSKYFVYKPRSRQGAARFIKKHRHCGHYGPGCCNGTWEPERT